MISRGSEWEFQKPAGFRVGDIPTIYGVPVTSPFYSVLFGSIRRKQCKSTNGWIQHNNTARISNPETARRRNQKRKSKVRKRQEGAGAVAGGGGSCSPKFRVKAAATGSARVPP